MNITIVADVFGEANNGTTITIKRLNRKFKKPRTSYKVVSASGTDGEDCYSLPSRNFLMFNEYIKKTA